MITNENKHEGLENAAVRDFLAKNIGTYSFIGSVKVMEEELRKAQERLELAKKHESAIRLIRELCWEEFDVSDHVDYDSDTYFPFVGTKEEKEKIFGGG